MVSPAPAKGVPSSQPAYRRVREKLEKDHAPTNKDFTDFFDTVGDPDDHPKIQTLLDKHPKGRAALVAYIKKSGKHKSALRAAEPSDDEDYEKTSNDERLDRILDKAKKEGQ